MLLSTQTQVLTKSYTDEQIIDIVSGAGFDALDYSMDNSHMLKADSALTRDEVTAQAKKLKALAADKGLVYNQCHAPAWGMEWGKEDFVRSVIFPTTVRSMELAAALGVKIIVVHPIHHLPWRTHAEELFEMNMKFYKALEPYCEEYGIKVATENMWNWDRNRRYIIDDTCSTAAEFNRYVDTFNSKWLTGCLDLGHTVLVGSQPEDMIRAMGNKRIQALHVHDVLYTDDTHTMPYLGKINWDNVTQALADIDYQGDFTFEADYFFARMPAHLQPGAVKMLHDTGRSLIADIQAKKK
jgi:sugar phosphate isomerase/epimerase